MVANKRQILVRGFRALAVMILTAGAVLIASTAADAAKLSATQTKYLSQADSGVSAASAWNNSKFHWYNKVLNDTKRSPLAAIWDVVPLWESVDYDAMVQPTAANLALVKKFATHAEGYWDTHVTPSKGVRTRTPAYAPYPGSYNNPKTFFDDNSWWGLAFMDSYAVTKSSRYLSDAKRAYNFITKNGWCNSCGGGMWWNTYHTIRSGEALGAATDLAARLYQATGNRAYLNTALKFITWANKNLLKWDGSYGLSGVRNEAVMPHDGEGAMLAAFTSLCEARAAVPIASYSFLPPNQMHGKPSFRRPGDPTSWCSWADGLANHTAFGVNPGNKTYDAYFPLNNGPQWDAIYVRGIISFYDYAYQNKLDPRLQSRLYQAVTKTADQIASHARTSGGLFLKTWTGSTRIPDGGPNMLRTHASSVSVFAALATAPPPS